MIRDRSKMAEREKGRGMVGIPPPMSMELRILSSYEGSYIHAYARSGTGTRSYSMVRAHLCDRRSCNTCLYPSTGSVRACQTDDEKEVVHSRWYPREVEGIRAGVDGGGGTREGAGRGRGSRGQRARAGASGKERKSRR